MEEIIFFTENQCSLILSVGKKLFCSSSRRLYFDRKITFLERINFVFEEINLVDKKLVCSIPGGNSFGKKF